MLDFIVAIPARYASTRLPGKPLRIIGDKPMILHVAEQALQAGAKQVVIATDDMRIADAIRQPSITVCMTSSSHQSGTDRIAECAEKLHWRDDQIVVNLQGDEPFAPPACIKQVAQLLSDSNAQMATLATHFDNYAHFIDNNAVKIAISSAGLALYFSRAPIPWPRDMVSVLPANSFRHLGIYAYTAGFLKHFSQLAISELERVECLEQLRALENGHQIAVQMAVQPFPAGVDTLDDLNRAISHWQALQSD